MRDWKRAGTAGNTAVLPASWRRFSHIRCLGALLLAGLLHVLSPLAAASLEDQVKAAFLFNFATFVEWPQQGETSRAEFVIGILGDDPFGAAIDEIVAGEQVNGRPLVVHRYPRIEDLGACDILFVSRSEQGRLQEAFQHLQGRPVLTVSDTPDFAELGGMIGFFTDQGRVQLSINRNAVESAQLEVSSKLLRLARIVRTRQRS